MTDDSQAEYRALREVFPNSKLILCAWHMCEAVRRWTLSHLSSQVEKKSCFELFQTLLYAESAEAYQSM